MPYAELVTCVVFLGCCAGQGEAESWLEIHHKAYGAYADAGR